MTTASLNLQKLASLVAALEKKKESVSIGNIREVIRIVLYFVAIELSKSTALDFAQALRKYGNKIEPQMEDLIYNADEDNTGKVSTKLDWAYYKEN